VANLGVGSAGNGSHRATSAQSRAQQRCAGQSGKYPTRRLDTHPCCLFVALAPWQRRKTLPGDM